MKGGHKGSWDRLTAEQRQDRIDRMLAARARNRTKGGRAPKTKQALPAEIVHTTIPEMQHNPHQASGATLEALAQLIVAVWKKL